MLSRKVVSFSCFFTALILLLSGALKALDHMYFIYALRAFWGKNVFVSFSFVGALIALEFAMALWLLSGRFRLAAMRVATFLFLMFTLYHLIIYSQGYHRPCGCLGPFWSAIGLKPNVWWDNLIAVVPFILLSVSLLFSTPSAFKQKENGRKYAWFFMFILFCCLFFLSFFWKRVEGRNLKGIAALWGSFEEISPQGDYVKNRVEAQLRQLLAQQEKTVLAAEDLVYFLSEIAQRQSRASLEAYSKLMKKRGGIPNREKAEIIRLTLKGSKKKDDWLVLKENVDAAAVWTGIAPERMTFSFKDPILLSEAQATKHFRLHLESGDLSQKVQMPSFFRIWPKKAETQLVLVTLPLKTDKYRHLFAYLLAYDAQRKQWILLHAVVISSQSFGEFLF
jgi:hypothetical protein